MSKTRQLEVPVATQRRRQIIDAAKACVADVGVERTTIREVARRAGLSHTTVANYFESMRDLLDAAMLEEAEKYLDSLRGRQRDYSVRGLADLMMRFLRPDVPGPRFVVKVIESGQHDLQLRTAHNQYVEFGVSSIERSVRAGIKSGELRSDIDPRTAARLLHSVVIWWASEIQSEATTPESAEEVTTLALDLLKPPRATPGATESPETRDTLSVVQAALKSDPRIQPEDLEAVMKVIEGAYSLAVNKPSSQHPDSSA